MKKLFVLIPILTLFTSCSLIQKKNKHYLGTLENIKYVVSHEDSLKIERSKIEINKGYFTCEMENHGDFRGGASAFRQFIYDNFKAPKNAKAGENHILVTIGKQNNLEGIEVLKYTDEETKKTIEDLFKLKPLNNWTSANLYFIPVKQQFEISIFIK
jgi:hypothetical protein